MDIVRVSIFRHEVAALLSKAATDHSVGHRLDLEMKISDISMSSVKDHEDVKPLLESLHGAIARFNDPSLVSYSLATSRSHSYADDLGSCTNLPTTLLK